MQYLSIILYILQNVWKELHLQDMKRHRWADGQPAYRQPASVRKYHAETSELVIWTNTISERTQKWAKTEKSTVLQCFSAHKKPVQRREKQAFGFRWCKFQFCKDLSIVFISGDQKCSENILKKIRLLPWLLTGYWHIHILGWNWKVKKHCVCSAFLV